MLPLPVSESGLCKFVTYLAEQGLKYRTIKTYLSGTQYLHIRSGLQEHDGRADEAPHNPAEGGVAVHGGVSGHEDGVGCMLHRTFWVLADRGDERSRCREL